MFSGSVSLVSRFGLLNFYNDILNMYSTEDGNTVTMLNQNKGCIVDLEISQLGRSAVQYMESSV